MYSSGLKIINELHHLSLMMTSAQVLEKLVPTTGNSPSQSETHPDDQTTLSHVTPGLFNLLYSGNCKPGRKENGKGWSTFTWIVNDYKI